MTNSDNKILILDNIIYIILLSPIMILIPLYKFILYIFLFDEIIS
jgi:hypothetical protein